MQSLPAGTLHEAGLRVTALRMAVLEVLGATPHSTADVVIDAVEGRIGPASRQGVYDALNTLVSAGVLRRIEPAGSPARFETRTGDNHHHVVCRRCGVTADVDCDRSLAPCLDPVDPHGFRLDEAEITFWGLCPDCQEMPREEHNA